MRFLREQVIDYIKENRPEELIDETVETGEEKNAYTDVEFEDLEKVEATIGTEETEEE